MLKVAYRRYFVLLAATLAFAVVRASLARGGGSDADASVAILPFIVSLALAASCVATWAVAVAIASVHRVTWPLVVCVALVVSAAGALAMLWASS